LMGWGLEAASTVRVGALWARVGAGVQRIAAAKARRSAARAGVLSVRIGFRCIDCSKVWREGYAG
jgi:hypothetical protein